MDGTDEIPVVRKQLEKKPKPIKAELVDDDTPLPPKPRKKKQPESRTWDL
jgi:hypothetical protein